MMTSKRWERKLKRRFIDDLVDSEGTGRLLYCLPCSHYLMKYISKKVNRL